MISIIIKEKEYLNINYIILGKVKSFIYKINKYINLDFYRLKIYKNTFGYYFIKKLIK